MDLQPCEGNCEYGNKMYDGSKCGCIKCPNFELCHVWSNPIYFDCHHGRCVNCNVSFRKNLVIRDSEPEICCICLDEKKVYVSHPSECGHEMCIDCFREQWWPKSEVNLEPRDYGFSTTCTCEECVDDIYCVDAIENWEKTCPDDAARWREEENKQQDILDAQLAERANPEKCPLCRKHLLESSNNSWYSLEKKYLN